MTQILREPEKHDLRTKMDALLQAGRLLDSQTLNKAESILLGNAINLMVRGDAQANNLLLLSLKAAIARVHRSAGIGMIEKALPVIVGNPSFSESGRREAISVMVELFDSEVS